MNTARYPSVSLLQPLPTGSRRQWPKQCTQNYPQPRSGIAARLLPAAPLLLCQGHVIPLRCEKAPPATGQANRATATRPGRASHGRLAQGHNDLDGRVDKKQINLIYQYLKEIYPATSSTQGEPPEHLGACRPAARSVGQGLAISDTPRLLHPYGQASRGQGHGVLRKQWRCLKKASDGGRTPGKHFYPQTLQEQAKLLCSVKSVSTMRRGIGLLWSRPCSSPHHIFAPVVAKTVANASGVQGGEC